MRWTLLAILLLGLAAASLPLKPHLVVPEWDVFIADEHGAPVSGMKVDERWHEYPCRLNLRGFGCQRVSHQTEAVSGADGHAHFPAVHDRHVFLKCLGGTSQQMDQMMASARGNFRVPAIFGGDSVVLPVEDRGYCIDWLGPTSGQTSKVVIPDKWLYGQPGAAIR